MARPGTLTRKRLGIAILNLAASIHLVWFYLACVPSELNLPQYEQGLERTPFQHRLLMSFPLRWAHNSPWLSHLALQLNAQHAWFPHGVRPEGVVEAAIDLLCVIITGLVAKSLYDASSPRKLLSQYVYPLTLLMVAGTYCLNTIHRFRFVFDLPSMAFFSIGLYLIYFRRSVILFALLFCIATINRETTLFLLIVCLLTRWSRATGASRSTILKQVFDLRTTLLLTSLSLFWIVWRRWVFHHFSANPSATGPRFWLNIGTLLWPTTWAQFLCAFAFCWPLCLAGRTLVRDKTLHAWYWVLPVWLLFMMRYGILIETRVFGELIPCLACFATLIAEENLLRRIGSHSEACTTEPQPYAERPLAASLR
jgi:hypothetical protein